MALIEGVGDDVITLLFVLFTIVILIVSWLSTNVREFAFPANLLVIERRSRRLYTTTINGNLNRIITTRQLSPSATTTTSTTLNSQSNSNRLNNNLRPISSSTLSSIASNGNNLTSSSSSNVQNDQANNENNSNNGQSVTRITSDLSATGSVVPNQSILTYRQNISSRPFSIDHRGNELELVNEMVEQALVENLLEGSFYTSNDIELIHSNTNNNLLNQGGEMNNNNRHNNNEANLDTNSSSVSTTNNTSNASSTNQNNNSMPSNLNTNENIVNSDNGNNNNNASHGTTINLNQNVQESSNNLSTNLYENDDNDLSSTLPINILIRFVNEKEMKIQAKPEDTILFLKKTHFGQELSNNKIVRFIYQGQFLCDKNTIKSYNIRDQTTIHCHITSKPQQQQQQQTQNTLSQLNFGSSLSNATTNTIRQQINSHQLSTIARITGINSSHNNTNNNNNNDMESSNASLANSTNTNNGTTTNLATNSSDNGEATSITTIGQSPTIANSTNNNDNANSNINSNNNVITNTTNHRHNQLAHTATIINIDFSNFLLPLFAIVLASCWYFRVNFKHFFSPLSTLILVIFTFIYALFLLNNIHSTSTMAANNLIFYNRILHRRVPPASTPPTTTPAAAAASTTS